MVMQCLSKSKKLVFLSLECHLWNGFSPDVAGVN